MVLFDRVRFKPKNNYSLYLIQQRQFCRAPYLVVVDPNFSPRWVVNCRNCLASFTHSQVGKARLLADYLSPTAPELPPGGQEMECPSCKTSAIYTQKDLNFRLK